MVEVIEVRDVALDDGCVLVETNGNLVSVRVRDPHTKRVLESS